MTNSFDKRDECIQEIVGTKLKDMVDTVVASSSTDALQIVSYNNKEDRTDKLIREIVCTKLDDIVKTVEACSTGDSLEFFLSQNYLYKYKQLTKETLWVPKQSRT